MGHVEDVTASRSTEELQQLLMSGISCAQLGVSIVEVGPPAGSGNAADSSAASQPDSHALGRILYANPALERMVGRSASSLMSQSLGEVLGPRASPDDLQRLAAALQSRSFSQVTALARRDGSEGSSIWTRISVTPINQLPFSSAAWLPGLQSSSPVSPLHSMEATRSTDSSRYSSPAISRGTSKDLTHPSTTPNATSTACDAVAAAMSQLVNEGGGNGEDQEGACTPWPLHCLCVHQDVSARMSEQLGSQLRDHALSSCSEGVAIVDPNQRDSPLVYVNDAFLHITGYGREEVLGRNCRFLQGPATSPDAVNAIRTALAARQQVTLELVNYKKNGEEFWNRLSLTPVFDDGGRLVSYIGVQSDVTELMRRKEEERRLLEAKVAAETATEAKSMFLANMSHEIRTPLNGMMATAQLLLASALTPEQRELAETILESGNSLLSILGDILDFCKLDHGAMELQREPVNLRTTVEACIEIVAPEALRKGLALSYAIDDEAATHAVLADPIRLRQVLANLLSNAVKFTEHGEVAVEVRIEDGDAQVTGPLPAPLPASSGAESDAGTPWVAGSTGSRPQAIPCWYGPDGAACHSAPPSIQVGALEEEAAAEGEAGPAARGTSSLLPADLAAHMRHSLSQLPADGGHMDEEGAVDAVRARSEPAAGEQDQFGRASLDADSASTSTGTTSSHSPSRRVHLVVRDTGIGISPDMAQRLFQCFRQGQEAMTRRYGGTGLGLAISHRLSELMGGSVWVESSGVPGEGSAFHLCVPADTPQSASHHRAGAGSGYAPHFSVLAHDETTVLRGRRVVVDLEHAGCARQVAQSCGHLGMVPVCGDATDPELLASCDVAVVGVSRAKPALKAGWKGRPVVAVGPRDALPAPLQPLVVMVGLPVAHARLSNALVKSTVLLKWSTTKQQPTVGNSGSGAAVAGGSASSSSAAAMAMASVGPKVSAEPINPQLLADFKSWRAPHERRTLLGQDPVGALASAASLGAIGGPASMPGLGLSPQASGAGGGVPQAVAPIRTARGGSATAGGNGLYLGGQLAVAAASQQPGAALGSAVGSSPVATAGIQRRGYVCTSHYSSYSGVGDGFGVSGVYSRLGLLEASRHDQAAYDALMRRSSLDNASLDRARVLAASGSGKRSVSTSVDGTGAQQGPGASSSQVAVSSDLYSPPASSASSGGSPTQQPGSSRSRIGAGMCLPACIPENTVLLPPEQPPVQPHTGSSPRSLAAATYDTVGLHHQAWLQPPPPSQPAQAVAAPLAPRTSPFHAPSAQPLPQPGRTPEAQPAAAQSSSSSQAAGQPPLRVLIAEDNKVNQKVVLKVLAQITAGCTPDVVENGVQVLAALARKTYDLILMDIHMPEMDGLEATRRIVAAYPPRCRPRIIALSADTLQALHDRCKEAGIEEFIVKPFRVEDLKRVMQTCRRVGQDDACSGPEGAAGSTEAGTAGDAPAALSGPSAAADNAVLAS